MEANKTKYKFKHVPKKHKKETHVFKLFPNVIKHRKFHSAQTNWIKGSYNNNVRGGGSKNILIC
jgi:hypothetical protein